MDTSKLMEISLPVLLTLIGGAIGWFLKDRIEAARAREERLHEERVQLYAKLLEPLVGAFTGTAGAGQAPSPPTMASPAYREAGFKLVLLGSESVVKKWNAMMQYLYTVEDRDSLDINETLRRFGAVLLEIRKSLGASAKELSELDMLRWLIRDLDSRKGR